MMKPRRSLATGGVPRPPGPSASYPDSKSWLCGWKRVGEERGKLVGGQDHDAIWGDAPTRFQADHGARANVGLIHDELAEASEVVVVDRCARLRLDREAQVIEQEVDLDAACQSPVRQVGLYPVFETGAAKLVVDPVFEGIAEEFAASLKRSAPSELIDHPHVAEVELRSPDHSALRALRLRR